MILTPRVKNNVGCVYYYTLYSVLHRKNFRHRPLEKVLLNESRVVNHCYKVPIWYIMGILYYIWGKGGERIFFLFSFLTPRPSL
jgi:hypothetical protein